MRRPCDARSGNNLARADGSRELSDDKSLSIGAVLSHRGKHSGKTSLARVRSRHDDLETHAGRDETSVTSTMKRVIRQAQHARGNVKRRGCWALQQQQQQQQQERRRRQRRPSLAWECDIIPRSVSACAASRGISAERPPLLDLVVSRHDDTSLRYIYSAIRNSDPSLQIPLPNSTTNVLVLARDNSRITCILARV